MSDTTTPFDVLVIEDDADTRANLQDILELDGYRVESVGTARDALRRDDWPRFQVIILDRRLPDGSAEDLMPELRRLAPQAAIIIVTGYPDVQGAISALRLGATDYALKPINPDELRTRLSQVAERFRAEEQVRTLNTILAESPTPVLRVAGDGTLVYANVASEPLLRAWGCRPGQPLPVASGKPIRESLDAGSTREIDVTCGERTFSLLLAPVAGAGYANVYGRDVTAHRAAEAALRATNRDLERALAELHNKTEEARAMSQQLWQAAKLASVGELAASIAHELNNPLATVSLRVESVLAQVPADDRKRRALEVVDQETRRMASLVANLLQFSRKDTASISTLDVHEELQKTLELVRHHLRKRSVTVVKKLPPDLPPVYADRQKLHQVFLNLLTNASDAMPEGGTLTLCVVETTLAEGRAGLSIEFSDTGVGIPSANLQRILEPFFTTKEEGKGTGLGLAICRRIIQEHHGTLHLASEVGKGTTVRIVLPAGNAAATTRKPGTTG